MSDDYRYPLMDNEADRLKAASGRPLADVTLDAAAAGQLGGDDVRVSAETLHAQAAIARRAGYTQLAANLTRAAELTTVPSDDVLKMYELLRPGRASYARLQALAQLLETEYAAHETAKFVREAADAYRERGLLLRER